MALEKLIVCRCRHTVDYHDDFGCHGRMASARCPCALRPRDVVDQLIAVELEATRRRWFGEDARAPLDDY